MPDLSITLVTRILAAASAVSLASLSGCHATPPSSGFVATQADKATEARLKQPAVEMPPLQPFDEGFGAAQIPAQP